MEEKIADKVRLRKEMKQARDALTLQERADKSRLIAEKLTEQDWYKENGGILVYSAIRSEVDLSGFCKQAWQDGKLLYFPRVTGDDMEFYAVDSLGQLESGCFGVLEPRVRVADDGRTIIDEAGDGASYAGRQWCSLIGDHIPVLVPGVAFSRKGQRIGYGKGYYDRYLDRHPELMPIGVCFEVQLVAQIDADLHDYAMRQIVTEQAVYVTDERKTISETGTAGMMKINS